jgi:hypothetical protein
MNAFTWDYSFLRKWLQIEYFCHGALCNVKGRFEKEINIHGQSSVKKSGLPIRLFDIQGRSNFCPEEVGGVIRWNVRKYLLHGVLSYKIGVFKEYLI